MEIRAIQEGKIRALKEAHSKKQELTPKNPEFGRTRREREAFPSEKVVSSKADPERATLL